MISSAAIDTDGTLAVLGVATLANTLTVTNLTTLNGNVNTPTANASVAINVGANVTIDTASIKVGNSSVNTVITSTGIDTDGTLAVLGVAALANTLTVTNLTTLSGNINTPTANASVAINVGANVGANTTALRAGTTTINTVSINVGSNVAIDTVALRVGNSTVNTVITSTAIDTDGTLAVLGVATLSDTLTVTNLSTLSGNVNTPTANASVRINVGANVFANTTAIRVGDNTTNTLITNTYITVASYITTGANVVLDTAALRVGNSTVNTVITSTAIDTDGTLAVLGASTLSDTLAVTNLTTLSGNVNTPTANVSVGMNVGANVSANTTALRVGNSSVNTVITSTAIDTDGTLAVLGTTTLSSTLTVSGLAALNGNVNTTTANASVAVNIGANVVANTTALSVSTSGSNATINAIAFVIGNTQANSTYLRADNGIFNGNLTVNGTFTTVSTMDTAGSIIPTTSNTYLLGNTTNIYRAVNTRDIIVENAVTAANVSVNASGTLNITAGAGVRANGALGTAGHVLHSNGSSVYWDADNDGVTSVVAGSGLNGGTITTTGTVSVLANNGIIANATGVFVNGNTGLVVNTSGVHVNTAFVSLQLANNATNLNGQPSTFYTNATNITAGTLDTARLPATANVTTAVNVGANVNLTTSDVRVGNSITNVAISSTQVTINGAVVNSTSFPGNANSATRLATARAFSTTGDVVASGVNFDGTAAVALSTALSTTGVSAGQYSKVTVDLKGRVTEGAYIASGDVTSALGFTPVNKAGDTMTGNLTVPYLSVSAQGGDNGGEISLARPGSSTVLNANVLIDVYGSTLRIFENASPFRGVYVDFPTALGGGTAQSLLIHSNNFNSFAPTLTGTGASGTWNITANNATYLNGQLASFYTNATNIATGTVPTARLGTGTANTTTFLRGDQSYTTAVTSITSANGLVTGTISTSGTISVLANNGIIANTTGLFVAPGLGTVVNSTGVHVYANNGIIANTTGLFVAPGSGTIVNSTGVHVYANTGVIANATGVYVNSAYIATIAANSSLYSNGSITNTFTVGTGTYFVTNGNVGIGTSSPTDKLFVSGSATITGNLTVSGTTTYVNTSVLNVSDNIVTLNADVPSGTAPTENAGIEINRGSSANVFLRWNESADNWEITKDGSTYANLVIVTELSSYQTTAGLSANVATLTSNNASNFNGQAASFYANATNLTSGTLPAARLSGTYNITANNAAFLGGTAAASYATLSGATFTGGVAATSFTVNTNQYYYMNTAGSVRMGWDGTNIAFNQPVSTTAGMTSTGGYYTPASVRADTVFTGIDDGPPRLRAGAGVNYVTFRWDSANLYYNIDGALGDGRAIDYVGAPSDSRLKDNIANTNVNSLGIINSIKLRQFDWNEEGLEYLSLKEEDKFVKVGVIAQEIEDLIPESIFKTKMGPESLETRLIKTDTIVPYLIGAIQQQQKQIDTLEARLSALENGI